MVDSKYANAYSEVLEILKYIPKEDYNKIPKTKIDVFKTNANTNYNFIYNPSKTLDEQDVSKIAKGIIAILFRDYWATEIQRERIINKQRNDRIKIEEEKREKYNIDILFKSKNINLEKEDNSAAMVEYKESFFIKFKNWFKRNNQ